MLLFPVADNEVTKREAEALSKSANTSSVRHGAEYEETGNNGQNYQGILQWQDAQA
jgi:hypothetical protein